MSEADPREELGILVRETWIAFARERGDERPSHLAGWEDLDEENREVDMRIGEAVAARVREEIVTLLERAADGRLQYRLSSEASGGPEDSVPALAGEEAAFRSAARLVMHPEDIVRLIPSWAWTQAEHGRVFPPEKGPGG